MRRLLLVTALAVACGKPGVAPGLDQFTCDGGLCDAPGVIEGALVYAGPARGDAILLLFDSAALPPPDGNGTSAAAVARIPEATLFAYAAAGSIGPFSAPFTFTQVPSGRTYQIRAFIDTTHQWDPFFDYAQQPRAGDPAGGHGEIGTDGQAHLTSIAVGAAQRVTGVSVALTQTVPYDPPSFVIAGGAPTIDISIDRPVRMRLQIANLTAQNATFPQAHFAVEKDPNPPASFGDGLGDVFPRVVLRQIRAADGTPVAPADAAIVPCRAIAVPVLPQLAAMQPGAVPIAQDNLDVLVEPFAIAADQATRLPKIPAGAYQVVVIEKTGQVWTLPNQLGDARAAGTPYYAQSQAQAVTFAAQATLPANSVSGAVVYHGDASLKSGNIVVQAYLDTPYAPPPPLGAAAPVRVQIIPAAAVTKTSDGFTAPYRIDGLPKGNYIIQALDDVDGNFSPLNILQTPTKGDLVGAVIDTTTLRPASVAVSGAVTGKDVLLAQQIALDPPSFEFASARAYPADSVAPLRFDVVARSPAFPIASAAAPVFTVSLVRDAGGATVDSDADGLPDVWPRAFLVRLDSSDPTELAQAQNPDQPGQVVTQVIPAAIDPTPFMPALLSGGTYLATRLTVIARPVLLDASDPTKPPVRLAHLAPGKYKLVLVNQTGQVWQVPNEAGSAALTAQSAALAPTQSQSQAFTVTVPSALNAGTISGKLTVAGAFYGAYVFAYDAANPPPPAGFGTPVSADFHGALEFSAGSVAYNLQNLLTTKAYIVTAVVDTRGDLALSPQLFAAAPGEGTLVGVHAAVPAGSTGVDITAASALPPRPSFTALNDVVFSDAVTPQRLALHAAQVLTSGVVVKPEAHAPQFLVSYQGCDSGGKPVDQDFDNLPDLYPRVVVVKLNPTGLDPDPAGIAIPAAIDPTRFTLGACTARNVVPASDISVILSPVAVNRALQTMPIPAGRYGVVVMQSTGQTWRLPNELSLLDPRAAAAAPSLSSQAYVINVAAQPQTTASISGAVNLSGYGAADVGNVIVAAYDASNPPPPLGLGHPLAAQVIPRPFTAAYAGASVQYLLTNLDPAKTYVVAALIDPSNELSPSLSFMATPPFGAQSSYYGGAAPVAFSAAGGASGKDITLSKSQQALPFERPAFVFDGTSQLSLSLAAGGPAVIKLNAATPSNLPYTPAATAGVFHPTPAICGPSGKQIQNPALSCTPGQAYQDTTVTCGAAGHPWISTQVYASPLSGSGPVPYVSVNQCQFCTALTGFPDCSAAPTFGGTVSSITAAVTTTAVPSGTVATGAYAITVVEPTGQSWSLPNELGAAQGADFVVVP